MRRFVYYGLASATLLMGFVVSSTLDLSEFIPHQHTRHYRVALVAVCNPGTPCRPDTPEDMAYKFFKHPSGIARHMKKISNDTIKISGKSTTWLRAHQRLKNLTDVYNQLPHILQMASSELTLSDYDIFFIYVNTPGQSHHLGFPKGQLINLSTEELNPGLGIMINAPTYDAIDHHDKNSSVLPSVGWLTSLFAILGISSQEHQSCPTFAR